MARKNKSKTIYLSLAGQAALNKELAELMARRPEMIELINASKELGSSEDNSDLDDVRRQQGFLEGRIDALQALLHEAEIIAVPKTRNKIMLGSTVELSSAEGPDTYTIVGRAEANPARGLISNESPLGLALLSHKVGETIVIKAPAGEFTYKIEKIENLAAPIVELPAAPSPAAVVGELPSGPTVISPAPAAALPAPITTLPALVVSLPEPVITLSEPSDTLPEQIAILPEQKEPPEKTSVQRKTRRLALKNKRLAVKNNLNAIHESPAPPKGRSSKSKGA